jgi:hypothetical protein
MNLNWLIRNTRTTWKYRYNHSSFWIRLLWLYSKVMPARLRIKDYVIDFSYEKPIEKLRLLLRANNGADAFIHSEVFEHQYCRLPLVSDPETILEFLTM